MTDSNHPALPFVRAAVDLPGLTYGEFDLRRGDSALAPFKAALITVAPGRDTPLDTHAVRECWYVVSGVGLLSYGETRHEIVAEQLLFFDPHQQHTVRNTGDATLIILSLWWP
jgi:mannose-6-phosphate isomerase-like protein (cupin superfamily)